MLSWSSVAREPSTAGAGPALAARQAQQALRVARAHPARLLRLRGATVDGVTPPLLDARGRRMGPAMAASLLGLTAAQAPLQLHGVFEAARRWLDGQGLIGRAGAAEWAPVLAGCAGELVQLLAGLAPCAARPLLLLESDSLQDGCLPPALQGLGHLDLWLTSQDLLMAWNGSALAGATH